MSFYFLRFSIIGFVGSEKREREREREQKYTKMYGEPQRYVEKKRKSSSFRYVSKLNPSRSLHKILTLAHKYVQSSQREGIREQSKYTSLEYFYYVCTICVSFLERWRFFFSVDVGCDLVLFRRRYLDGENSLSEVRFGNFDEDVAVV